MDGSVIVSFGQYSTFVLLFLSLAFENIKVSNFIQFLSLHNFGSLLITGDNVFIGTHGNPPLINYGNITISSVSFLIISLICNAFFDITYASHPEIHATISQYGNMVIESDALINKTNVYANASVSLVGHPVVSASLFNMSENSVLFGSGTFCNTNFR